MPMMRLLCAAFSSMMTRSARRAMVGVILLYAAFTWYALRISLHSSSRLGMLLGFGLTLGAETNSLILVSHSLKYPSSASTIVTNRIQVRDASHQSARIRDAVLPVLQYTGSLIDYRAENTVFVVENLSPLSLDISEAEAGLDTATKTVWVSGLKYVPQCVILTIR